ncbi:MAG: hypothetical protein IJW29_08455 [Clostridia bacterium]|nr:hypothetical protein [Clostridia bacterium]
METRIKELETRINRISMALYSERAYKVNELISRNITEEKELTYELDRLLSLIEEKGIDGLFWKLIRYIEVFDDIGLSARYRKMAKTILTGE